MEINPFNIAVGNDGSNGSVNNPKCVDSGSVLSGEIKRFDCPTVMQGRYVTVYITRAVYLQVFELEVYEWDVKSMIADDFIFEATDSSLALTSTFVFIATWILS